MKRSIKQGLPCARFLGYLESTRVVPSFSDAPELPD